jgi:molecular chaperone DnaJ
LLDTLLPLAAEPAGSGARIEHVASLCCTLAMTSASRDPYQVLGVSRAASTAEIKAAYRMLVKRHHPDAGGDDDTILALNAAWEVLGDGERRRAHDRRQRAENASGAVRSGATTAATASCRSSEVQLMDWLQRVYAPIDRLLARITAAIPSRLQELAADPYDDRLMETFCAFLAEAQRQMEQVEHLFRSRPCPACANGFGLSLYHCLGQVQDGLAELERYSLGYVDDYLHDGRQMLREAEARRQRLAAERRRLDG